MRIDKISLALLASLVVTVQPARASTIVLDFEGLQDLERVWDFYNGGEGSTGSSGTDYAVEFGPLSTSDGNSGGPLALTSDGLLGSLFENEPSPNTVIMLGPNIPVMNAYSGFQTFSFWYSASDGLNVIKFYSGLTGTADLLSVIPLPENYQSCDGASAGIFECWSFVQVSLATTAFSVVFPFEPVLFDDISIGTAQVPVPEPATLLLLGTSFAGLAVAQRRRRRRAQ